MIGWSELEDNIEGSQQEVVFWVEIQLKFLKVKLGFCFNSNWSLLVYKRSSIDLAIKIEIWGNDLVLATRSQLEDCDEAWVWSWKQDCGENVKEDQSRLQEDFTCLIVSLQHFRSTATAKNRCGNIKNRC
jgi:hypothetical protein